MASNQLIRKGDPYFLIPLIQGGARDLAWSEVGLTRAQVRIISSGSNPDSGWTPLSIPLFFTYEASVEQDLEAGDPENTWAIFRFIEGVTRNIAVVDRGVNLKYKEVFDLCKFIEEEVPSVHKLIRQSLPKDEWLSSPELYADLKKVLDHLVEGYEQGSTFVEDYNAILRPLSFGVIRADSFNALVESTEENMSSVEGRPLSIRSYFDKLYSHATPSISSMPASFKLVRTDYFTRNLTDAVRNFSGYFSQTYSDENVDWHRAVGQHLDLTIFIDELYVKMKPWLKVHFAYAAMKELNLQFKPLARTNGAKDSGKRFAQFINALANQD